MLPQSANCGKLKAPTETVIGRNKVGRVQSGMEIEVDTDGIYSASINVTVHRCHITEKKQRKVTFMEVLHRNTG